MPSVRRHRIRHVGVLAMLVALGCAAYTKDTDFSLSQFGDATVIIARPSSRIIAERPRVVGAGLRSVLCTEPSPDVAIALARSGNLSGGASVPSGPSANLSAGFAASETATKMDGRTATVVALRDGLYFACQGYVNGVLGLNSYALILSRYGRLLSKSVGGEAPGAGCGVPVGSGSRPPVDQRLA